VVAPRGSISNVYGGYYPYGAVAAGVAVGAAATYYPYPYYPPCPTDDAAVIVPDSCRDIP
jgi:hypothetical protein